MDRRMGIIGFLFCICLYLMPCYVQAASTADATELISMEQNCDLTLSYVNDGTAFTDVPVTLYQIASVSEDFQYTLTDSFSGSGLSLNGIQSAEAWDVILSTLESHILANNTEPTVTAVTDQNGAIQFTGLKAGVYLLISEEIVQDNLTCIFEPSLINLPELGEDGIWQYDVTVQPKVEILPPFTPDGTDDEIELKVTKLWKGDADQKDRPKSVKVEIFRDKVSYEKVTLSKDNNWTYSWKTNDDGADWTVVERNVPDGYKVTVKETKNAFVLTNSLKSNNKTPGQSTQSTTTATKTGDTTNVLLYVVMLYVSGILIVLLGIVGKRKRG